MLILKSLLSSLSADLLLPEDRLDKIIRTAPHRYKVYEIPKKSGKGMRMIAQPAREVKRLQYWIIENVFPHFPVHPSATAYIRGSNIMSNCVVHANNPYLLKLDFKDFFPSIKGEDFQKYAKNFLDVSEADLKRLTSILFWRALKKRPLQLSIGAPSSPYLSNAMMLKFDLEVDGFCREKQVAYTRYADDLTFSMKDKALRTIVLQKVCEILKALPYPTLTINEQKTIYCSKANRRIITGLVISNDCNVSLGHSKKRLIRAMFHNFQRGKLSGEEAQRLIGLLAFARSIEPGFVLKLQHRYEAKVNGPRMGGSAPDDQSQTS
jgi:RNA-directed DNA polymerase